MRPARWMLVNALMLFMLGNSKAVNIMRLNLSPVWPGLGLGQAFSEGRR